MESLKLNLDDALKIIVDALNQIIDINNPYIELKDGEKYIWHDTFYFKGKSYSEVIILEQNEFIRLLKYALRVKGYSNIYVKVESPLVRMRR